MKADKVYLVGFMAAGKTSVGRALARRLDWKFIDIDDLIERQEHMTVAEIFARHGEPYFRAVEREIRGRVGTRLALVLADVAFVRRGKIPKTTSGKVQRRELRARYLAQELERLQP